jgi:hypothetical protein
MNYIRSMRLTESQVNDLIEMGFLVELQSVNEKRGNLYNIWVN